MHSLLNLAAPAKLNLCLHVGQQRADGYHAIESLAVLIDLADSLSFRRRTDGLIVRHDVTDAVPCNDLCIQAAKALQQFASVTSGVDIELTKRIPMGAGLGGGSSDAATTLMGLNILWDLNLPTGTLMSIAAKLGADVPFFLLGRSAWMEGFGEKLTPVTVPPSAYFIFKPRASLSTGDVFRVARPERVLRGLPRSKEDLSKWALERARNDLEPAACKLCPAVTKSLVSMRQKFGNSRMSGSGSAVFSKVRNDLEAEPVLSGCGEGTLFRCSSLTTHPQWPIH